MVPPTDPAGSCPVEWRKSGGRLRGRVGLSDGLDILTGHERGARDFDDAGGAIPMADRPWIARLSIGRASAESRATPKGPIRLSHPGWFQRRTVANWLL